MGKRDLAGIIEALAAEVVLADPEDLQSARKIIGLFREAAGVVEGELADLIVPAAEKAVGLAEEMIVLSPEEAAGPMRTLNQIVKAFQAAVKDGPKAARALLPPEIGGGQPAGRQEEKALDDKILADFLSSQSSFLQELEEQILNGEKTSYTGKPAAELKRMLHTLKGEAGMLGLDGIQRVCHEAETYLEQGGGSRRSDALLAVKDWFAQSFDFLAGQGPEPGPAEEILALFQSSLPDGEAEEEPKKTTKKKKPAVEAGLPAAESAPAESGPAAAPETEEAKAVVSEEPVEQPESAEDRTLQVNEGDAQLLIDFIQEANGHLDNADVQLLTLESNPEDQESLNSVFRSFHTIKGVAGFLDLKDIKELSHVAEDVLDRSRKGHLMMSGAVMDTVFEAVDALRRLIKSVEHALSTREPLAVDQGLPRLLARLKDALQGRPIAVSSRQMDVEPNKKLGEILLESGKVKAETLNRALAESDGKSHLGEILVRTAGVPAKDVAQALRAQNQARSSGESVQVKETVKIDTERLDKLLDAIGELVIAESMVSQSEEILANVSPDVARNLNHLSKITRVVQELGMTMRMVPIRPTFQKMARLVRDLAKKSEKEVDFVTVGEETELDRSVVEKIGDPLIHIIRNSVDHGLEDDPRARVKAGKPAVGRIELKAFHRGGSIYIEVSDDGKGLDREAIIAKAVERGLVSNGSEMSDREVFGLIFLPGFSTAKKVTDVSGRGVGMDVVKRNIEALRGSVDLFSTRGQGTTISMRLPLTLAIIDGLIIDVGAERYIVPTLSVVESLRPREEDIHTVSGRGELLNLRGELIPMFRLSRVFSIRGAVDDPTRALAMIVEDQGRRIVLLVDTLIGQQQVVIKNLGRALGQVKGFAGGAVMSDGTVGLILDVSEIMRIASSRNERSVQLVAV
jgi:two-component system, chemotaxis family, sensor kinase CheA